MRWPPQAPARRGRAAPPDGIARRRGRGLCAAKVNRKGPVLLAPLRRWWCGVDTPPPPSLLQPPQAWFFTRARPPSVHWFVLCAGCLGFRCLLLATLAAHLRAPHVEPGAGHQLAALIGPYLPPRRRERNSRTHARAGRGPAFAPSLVSCCVVSLVLPRWGGRAHATCFAGRGLARPT
ncbi:MAG: hypothetical protein J3K34DRAFT_444752 [Monoraphidium minutum]|nr:MAG: hypothetical protein J3K34DRAFT_444752 [Monoraphidium minutum]